MKPRYTFIVTVDTFGTVTEETLRSLIEEELSLSHFQPEVVVTKISWSYEQDKDKADD